MDAPRSFLGDKHTRIGSELRHHVGNRSVLSSENLYTEENRVRALLEGFVLEPFNEKPSLGSRARRDRIVVTRQPHPELGKWTAQAASDTNWRQPGCCRQIRIWCR